MGPQHIYTPSLHPPHLPEKNIIHHIFPETRSPPARAPVPDSSIAVIDGLTGRSLTRRECISQFTSLAGGLRNLGLRRGDVVGIIALNSLEWLIAVWGSLAAGLRVSPINWAYTPPELLHQLSHSSVSLVFVSSSLVGTLRETINLGAKSGWTINEDRIVLTCRKSEKPKDLGRFKSVEELYDRPIPVEAFDGKESRETAFMCYSSGTTGLAKGVESTHHNMTSQLAAINPAYHRLHPTRDVELCFLPFSHMYGLALSVLQPFTIGVPLVVLPRFEEKSVLSCIEKYKITFALIVPPILIVLSQSRNIGKYNLKSLRSVMSAAAPLSQDLCKAFEEKVPGCIVTQGYGLTETSPIITMMTADVAHGRQSTIGTLIPTWEARLVDTDTGQDIPPHTQKPGELWVRGPSVMKGYYKNPDATNGTFHEGWFKTGDSAFVDKEGYFQIADRLKELIKYKGFQVAPAELEAVLLTHPKVADAAVIGIYEESQATELPRAYVVAKEMSKAEKEKLGKEVQEWIKSKVANHKYLRGGVVLVDVIPKSPTGKILRKILRAQVKEELERAKQKGQVRAKL